MIMIRKILIFFISLYASVNVFAQDTYIVQQFGNNLSSWASGQNVFSALDALKIYVAKVLLS